jgi:hypothetical protein
MRILDDHQNRFGAHQGLHLQNERFQRPLSALLRRQFERGIAPIIPKGQHLGNQCRVLPGGRGLRQQGVKLVAPPLRCVVVRQSSGTSYLTDDRIKRTICMLRRAKIAQACVRLIGNGLQQCRRKPRFADTGFPRQEYHLAFAGLCFRPAAQQDFEFFFAPDERGQGPWRVAPRSGLPWN